MNNKYNPAGWAKNRKVIFLDVDNVLTDFDRQFVSNAESKDLSLSFESVARLSATWWETMPWTPWGKELLAYAQKSSYVCLLTAHASEESASGKIRWINREIGNNDYMLASPKWAAASPNHLLIDDTPKKIARFVSAGGQGFLLNPGNIQECYKAIDNFVAS